jgi:hypothetical protein
VIVIAVMVMVMVMVVVAYKPRLIVMRGRKYRNAAPRGVSAERAAEARGIGGNRQIHLVHIGIGRNRMRAPRCRAGIVADRHSLIGPLSGGINHPELFGRNELPFGEEVVSIARVEPDFIVTAQVNKCLQDISVVLVDDGRI